MARAADRRGVQFRPAPLDGIYEIDLPRFDDDRGHFSRIFAAEEFEWTGLFSSGPAHINMSRTLEAGTVRGLHWQEVAPGSVGEAKFVACVSGKVLDVAVDVRPDSPTFGEHCAIELTDSNQRAVLIPPGFAHGIQALAPTSIIVYVNAAPYNPSLERGLRPDDPTLAIDWPLPIRNLSERDRSHPSLSELRPQ